MSNVLNDIIEGGSTLHNRIFTAMEFEKYFFKNRFAICSHVAVQGDAIIGFKFPNGQTLIGLELISCHR